MDAALALVGHRPEVAVALRELGLTALRVPEDNLTNVLDALRTLRFVGALVAPHKEEAVFGAVQPDALARRQGRVDAIALAGSTYGTHTLEEALVRLVDDSRYAVRGARLLLLGRDAPLRAALSLARLGPSMLTIATDDLPEAQRDLALLPAGTNAYAVSTRDTSFGGYAERADLVVLTNGSLPRGVLQPYHTLLDLTGEAWSEATRAGVPVLPATSLSALRLAAQLEHATGQKFKPEALAGVAQVLM
ncbi:shikimate dehydrogenase [Deinococcus yavapaiensis]|uniref:Shikimate dehydrogenase n=1 Tax=Deinococcus yavapaiensis KR-236 TaxID=694435 RepID=A0A318SD47_9DEIO|nr:shikimate dehydrogenase [Deinococcus yavapaiensis]PYE54811.1 shikimate dehydrogenase [Deinococcus yavapaiensis KR-236]